MDVSALRALQGASRRSTRVVEKQSMKATQTTPVGIILTTSEENKVEPASDDDGDTIVVRHVRRASHVSQNKGVKNTAKRSDQRRSIGRRNRAPRKPAHDVLKVEGQPDNDQWSDDSDQWSDDSDQWSDDSDSITVSPFKAHPYESVAACSLQEDAALARALLSQRPSRTRRAPQRYAESSPETDRSVTATRYRIPAAPPRSIKRPRDVEETSRHKSTQSVADVRRVAVCYPSSKTKSLKRVLSERTSERPLAKRVKLSGTLREPLNQMLLALKIPETLSGRITALLKKAPNPSFDISHAANVSLEGSEGQLAAAVRSYRLDRCRRDRVDLEPPDPGLVALSKKLTERLPIAEKSRPRGQPGVWADTRQALCETVPYFKTPQGGCHQNDGHVYSVYIDAVGHCREYMDTDVIISRSTGGMVMDRDGHLVQSRDHEHSSASDKRSKGQAEAMLNNIRHQNPLVVICGDRNEGALVQMPHKFCVLGWYKPVGIWTEKTRGKNGQIFKTIKYRFERLRCKDAWYEPQQPVDLTAHERILAASVVYACCLVCRAEHPQMYLCGWMCLTHDCPLLWKLADGRDADYGPLQYHPAYILHRQPWSDEQEPYNVRVPVPDVGNYLGDNLSYINTRGVCCPRCGRCNLRRLFKGWKCENPSCQWEKFPTHFPVKPTQLHSPWDTFGDGPSLGRNSYDAAAGVSLTVSHRHGMKIFRYSFDGVDGSLTHITSNATLNAAPDGPDDMLHALQQQDDPSMELPLERRVFAGTGVKTSDKKRRSRMSQTTVASDPPSVELSPECPSATDRAPEGDYMSAYSINYGMPYKFIASGASQPFEQAPWPVRHARANLNWASKHVLGRREHVDFNEQLIFAYLEKQKLEYHDDGEKGLGPRIATLSLGASAKMHLRMKLKHFVGCSKTGIMVSERPIPGALGGEEMYQRRLAAWQELETLKTTDRAAFLRRQKELPHELDIFKDRNRARGSGDLVVLTLNHGDVVLMEGYAIQQYFEHKVQSEGYLRFALTCRTVLDAHLRLEEKPAYEVPPDTETVSSLMRLEADDAMEEEEEEELKQQEAPWSTPSGSSSPLSSLPSLTSVDESSC